MGWLGVCDADGLVTPSCLPSLQLVLWRVDVGDLHFRRLALPRDSRGGTFQAA